MCILVVLLFFVPTVRDDVYCTVIILAIAELISWGNKKNCSEKECMTKGGSHRKKWETVNFFLPEPVEIVFFLDKQL